MENHDALQIAFSVSSREQRRAGRRMWRYRAPDLKRRYWLATLLLVVIFAALFYGFSENVRRVTNFLWDGMIYQYSEHFVLPLSHDEVVHGKGSLLSKMPGDCWQQFANLRAYYGYMWGYPGKKLLFMGGEFAQGREWNYQESLDWHLLAPEHGGWHEGVQRWVRDLNHAYRAHPALWKQDCQPEGFEWLVVDDAEQSVVAFARHDGKGNPVVIVSNFTPVPRENYRIGVSQAGTYHEILNSDDAQYNGSGMSGGKTVHTDDIGSHGKPHSLNLTLPPLATIFLALDTGAEG